MNVCKMIQTQVITSSSPSVSGNPRSPPSVSSVFNLLSVPRPAAGILFCGRSRMMYTRVEAPKCRWLSMGTCCGFLFSRRMLPMNVPCANNSNNNSGNTMSYLATAMLQQSWPHTTGWYYTRIKPVRKADITISIQGWTSRWTGKIAKSVDDTCHTKIFRKDAL